MDPDPLPAAEGRRGRGGVVAGPQGTGVRPPHRSVGVAIVAAFALFLSGCGAGDPGDAQPRPAGTGFGESVFSHIPLHPGSDPIGPLTEEGGVTSRSYRTDGATPRDVLDFYADGLGDEWVMTGDVEQIGRDSYRGRWASDDGNLQVSALPAPKLDDNPTADKVVTQYSLVVTELDS